MKILYQCGIVFAICLLGELIRFVTHLPIPGNVFGMVLLFLLLWSGILKKEHIAKVSDFLLGNMAFFFIPSAVAIIVYYKTIASVIIPFLLIIVFSTIIVMGATGQIAQLFMKLQQKSKSKLEGQQTPVATSEEEVQ